MTEPLSLDEVRHVARLARLRLDDAQLEAYREQLSAVLGHIERLEELDVTGVEPMAHPLDATNRLDDDEPGPVLPPATLLAAAPAARDGFLTVPKVLDEEASGS